jgi:hypothetical protein
MYKKKLLGAMVAAGCMLLPWAVQADNQFILSHPTSDPAPSVFVDPRDNVQKVFFYCTQDIIGGSGTYPIDTIHCYSTTDMYHWKDEGVSLDEKRVPWANKTHRLWAPHVVFLKGKYRLHAPETGSSGQFNFCSWANNPVGPYTPEAVGPLPGMNARTIDPFVFLDTFATMDANGKYDTTKIDSINVWYSFRHSNNSDIALVRMNDSSTKATGTIAIVNTGAGTGYKEGSWMWKRKNIYFLVFAFQPNNSGAEIIAYSTARNAQGPWTYRGQLFAGNTSPYEFTIHSGACDYKGQHYIWWHSLSFGGSVFGTERCSGIEYFTYSTDSTLNTSTLFRSNRGVGIPSAYGDSIQIDRYNTISGALTTAIPYNAGGTEKIGWYISAVNNNASVRYDSVDFTASSGHVGPVKMYARYASTVVGDTIIARIDSANGTIVGRLVSQNTTSLSTWITDSADYSTTGVSGHHNLFVSFKVPLGASNLNVNWLKFSNGTAFVGIDAPAASKVASASYSYTRTNKNTFTIVSPAATANARVNLFNVRGQEMGAVSARILSNNTMQVNLNAGSMASGAYILSVKNANGSQYKVPFVY